MSSDAEKTAFTSIDMTKTTEDTTGQCAFAVDTEGVKQRDGGEPWVFDAGATQHVSPHSSTMMEYRECRDTVLRCAGGGTYPIVSRGNLTLTFRSDGRHVVLHVKHEDHAPGVRQHRF